MHKIRSNGVALLWDRRPLQLANIRIIVDVGSANDPPDKPGLAHFMEHMFFKATEKRSTLELRRKLARLGYDNAYTEYRRTVYHMTMLPENLVLAGELFAEMWSEPKLDPDEIIKEASIISAEIQTRRSGPLPYFFDNAMEALYGPRWHLPCGTAESIASFTADDFQTFRKSYHCSPHLTISAVGNIDEGQGLGFLQAVAAHSWHHHDRNRSDESDGLEAMPIFADREFTHTSEQAVAWMVGEGITEHENAVLNYAWDLLWAGLSGAHGLLSLRLREELALCYHVSAFQLRNATAVLIMTDKKNLIQCRDEIGKIISKVAADGFTDEMLETARLSLLFTIAGWSETAEGIGSKCGDMIYDMNGVWVPPEEQATRIRNLTNADVIAMARRCWGANRQSAWMQMTQEPAATWRPLPDCQSKL